MSYALSRPTTARRGGLLGIVVGAHIGVILIVMAAKTVVPQIMEMPLVVDLIQPAQEKPPEAKPLPVVKPQPVRQQPTPQKHVPVIEATQSTLPAPAAPVATPPEVKPAPPAPPAPEPVVQARFDADYLKNPAPPYPPLSRRMGEEGRVLLRVSVTAQGTADNVEIKTSSGSQRLDESAQKTVRNWKFIPAKRGETAVQSWVLVPIIFKLEQ
ncbi:energy transducer TonB [uncultured Dechloromonas sp.]|uniref:energy transducer TonB n=1 Tax=uncultured Dechloromonas sp. TaxID=171719 RepID=UPI0025D023FE|nr:energy transducer TonB [uncultured Dechloromonas sp.]